MGTEYCIVFPNDLLARVPSSNIFSYFSNVVVPGRSTGSGHILHRIEDIPLLCGNVYKFHII